MLKKSSELKFLVFDLETTGVDPDQDAIIEMGAIKFAYNSSGELVKMQEYSQLFDPERSLPKEIEMITGIKPADLTGKPKIADQVSKFVGLFDDVDFILGHNVKFDISFIEKIIKIKNPLIDSQFFAEIFFPGLASYSLDVLPFALGIERGMAHRAFDDALASARVFISALQQFTTLKKTRGAILAAFKKTDAEKFKILDEALKTIAYKKPARKTAKKVHRKNIHVELVKAIAENINLKSQLIIAHTATSGHLDSIAEGIGKSKTKATILAVKDPALLANYKNLEYLHNPKTLLCQTRISQALLAPVLTSNEAILLAKILVADELGDGQPPSPRFSNEEYKYLPRYQYAPKLCQTHRCPAHQKITSTRNSQANFVISYKDYWQYNQEHLPTNAKLILADFDDCVEALNQSLEVRLNSLQLATALDYIPANKAARGQKKSGQQMLGLYLDSEGSPESDLKKSVQELKSKHDLFWQTLLSFYGAESDNGQVYITFGQNENENNELTKLAELAKAISVDLAKLISSLIKSKNQFKKAYAEFLNEENQKWSALSKNFKSVRMVLEKSFLDELWYLKFVQNEQARGLFRKLVFPTTLITSATGSDTLTKHYIQMLDLDEWPLINLKIPRSKIASLKIIKSPGPNLESTVKIASLHTEGRILVIAKNATEGSLYKEHLYTVFGEQRKIIFVDSGSASKYMHQFGQYENAILIGTARGKILQADWPEINIAIISSIPFPAPDPSAGFMESAFPKAMLAQKTLLAKILRSATPDLNIYLLDPRLTTQTYGENFILLAEELCGGKAERHTL